MAGIAARSFKCRMPDYDGDDEWTVVEAFDAQCAAEKYSENSDAHSAMERFGDNAEPLVIVKDDAGVERKFQCSREAQPVYFAHELDPQPVAAEPDEIPW